MATLFPDAADLPRGFVYYDDVISEAEETALVDELRGLVFGEVRMRGQVARRRTIHFGWTYGYESWRVEPGPPPPPFLLALRAKAGALIDREPDALAEVLVTHYPPGAGIGWHRDAPMFDRVVGVSLASPCRFRFRRGKGETLETTEFTPALEELSSMSCLQTYGKAGRERSLARSLAYM